MKFQNKTILLERQETPKSDELLSALNPEQRAAVTHRGGPLLIIAGAGTGKTTVITRRFAWLIREGLAKPAELLALTFTDKAAGEMDDRINQLLPLGYEELAISTFHSFGERFLRDNAITLGIDPGFKLLTTTESYLFLREHLFKFDLDYYRPLGNPTKFIEALLAHFSRAKDEDISPKEYLDYTKRLLKAQGSKLKARRSEVRAQRSERAGEREEAERILEIAKAYSTYEELKQKENLIDFGDLIVKSLQALRKYSSLAKVYQERFTYILVDEFQDTNFAQYQLLKMLVNRERNIAVCGDDDQAIYRFRGAAVQNILNFKHDFPKAREVVLTQNYRSSQRILDAAYHTIQRNNPARLEVQSAVSKRLSSQKGAGVAIEHLHFADGTTEARRVVAIIRELQSQQEYHWRDFAILVRANAHAEPFTRELHRADIPYQFVASSGLLKVPLVHTLVSYLRVLANPFDSVSLFHVLASEFFTMPALELAAVSHTAKRMSKDLFGVIKVEGHELLSSAHARKELDRFLMFLQKHIELTKTKSVSELTYTILSDLGIVRSLTTREDAQSYERIANLKAFYELIEKFESVSIEKRVTAFTQYVDLLIEAGEDPAPGNLLTDFDAVRVMTIHAAKGLEFPVVFLVNLVKGRFPSQERGESLTLPEALLKERLSAASQHLLEERRLFYVGLTRAKDHLILTSADSYGGARTMQLSPFIHEVAPFFTERDARSEQLALTEAFAVPSAKSNVTETDLTQYLPKRFSYTQLTAFENCPLQYKYAHIYTIPVLGSHARSYGISLHTALKRFYEEAIATGRVPPKRRLLELLKETWVPEFYLSEVHERARFKAAHTSLTKFYNDEKARGFPVPLAVEKPFQIRIGGHPFKGTIDRIDRVGKGNEVEIIDYKTGSVKEQREVDKDEQLGIYALVARDLFRYTPVKLTLYFLEEGQRVSTTRTGKELDELKKKISVKIEKIISSDFAPTPGFVCRFCDFKLICPYRADV
ncbi:MAG: UvrD-helicase domain-containing protein [Parcubacteria group bacterium]|nr:UvrD-helicase domain-containing protein [Parcubacteria group bacterium]